MSLSGKMAELYADYGHAYWINRLLGKAAHGKYLQCKQLKSSRRSGAQRKFVKACEREVEVLLPNAGVEQSVADVALREALLAKGRQAEQGKEAAELLADAAAVVPSAKVVVVKKEPL